MTKAQAKALVDLGMALTEWPMGWHSETAGGGQHFEVDYTVAKARRMEKVLYAATRAFPELAAAMAHPKESQ